MQNFISSLKKPFTSQSLAPSLSFNSSLTPGVTPSSVAATGTKPTPSPAKSAYISSLTSSTQPQVSTQQPSAVQNFQTPSGAVVGQDGSTISTPQPDKNQAYRAAYDQYIQSLTPSDAETQASKNLSSLSLQAEKDQEKALDSGETLGFASGEAARVNRNNSFGIRAAADTLGALSGARSATNDATKARADFEKGLLDSESKAEETKFDQGLATKNLGLSEKRLTQDTLESDRKFNEDKRQFGLEYALKEKQVAIDQQKANQSGNTASEPNVEQAKAQQFATAASNANNILNASDFGPSYLLDSKNLLFNGLKSNERQSFEQASRALVNAVLRRESGATINDDEFQNKYKELIPQPGDGDAVKKQKASARAAAITSITNAGGKGFTTSSPTSTSGQTSSGLKFTIIP